MSECRTPTGIGNRNTQEHSNGMTFKNSILVTPDAANRGIVRSRDQTIKFLRTMLAKQTCAVCSQPASNSLSQLHLSQFDLSQSQSQTQSNEVDFLKISIEEIEKKCEAILEKFQVTPTPCPIIIDIDGESRAINLLNEIHSFMNGQASSLQDLSRSSDESKKKILEVGKEKRILQHSENNLTAQLELKKNQLTLAEKVINESTLKMDEKDTQILDANTQNSIIKAELDVIKMELADMKKKLKEEKDVSSKLEIEIEKRYKDQMDVCTQKNHDLQKSKDELQAQLDMEKKIHAETKDKLNDCLSCLSKKIFDYQEKNNLIVIKLHSLIEKNEELKKGKEEVETLLVTYNEELQKYKDKLQAQLEMEKKKHDNNLKEIKDEYHARIQIEKKIYAETRDELNDNFLSLSKKLLEAEEKNNLMEIKLHDLIEVNKELKNEKDEVNTLLETSKEKLTLSKNRVENNLLIISEKDKQIDQLNKQLCMLQKERTDTTRQEQKEDIDCQDGTTSHQMVVNHQNDETNVGAMEDNNNQVVKNTVLTKGQKFRKQINNYNKRYQ